ncbi:PAS domain-containing protein [Chitiniphilus eburneus]|uniref:PAS domain S-box protein n=1 Tax=Chitiniphilus eburneus TaxID=2571148 RepID=A0A4U0PZN4_9NEIS|nr:PAS domain-containing protein [Chitiniphilus eburneus]TJZ74087.1 PAS domain S-box protein [Chitiniphilus eburneus]
MPLSSSSELPDCDALLPQVLSALPVGVAIMDRTLRYRYLNPLLAQSNGATVEAHLGHTVSEMLPSLAPTILPLLRKVLDLGEPLRDLAISGESIMPGRLRQWLADYLPLRDADGNVAGVLTVVRDVTDQREARQAALENERQLRGILDNLTAYVGLLALDGTLLEVNRAPLEAGGLDRDDVRGRKLWDTGWWRDDTHEQEQLREAVRRAAQGEPQRFDSMVHMAGDTRAVIDFILAPLFDADGNVTHLIPSGTDITARKIGEAALRLSEQRFRQVVENAPDGLAMVDEQGQILLVNAGIERMFRYRREQLIGCNVMALMPERYRAAHPALMAGFMRDPSARDMAGRRELFALRSDGSEFPVEIGLNPIPGDGGLRVLATIVDVTRRKADQAQLERALAEKTALLQEVHHRVKNNLQVISSLLSLQSRSASEEARRALAESQSRVKAMALIHQLLYERHDFSQVDIGLYLKRLCRLLQDTLHKHGGPVTLELATSGNVLLDLQRAVPCGLLINELVTNAFKHAFPAGREGRIGVRLSGEPAGDARLVVEDNGVGLPDGIEQGGGSLGFQLIPLLVDQLGGELVIERGDGTRFVVTFQPDGGAA